MSAVDNSHDPHVSIAARAARAAIHAYQHYLSPLKPGPTCKFEPTCSAYAIEAVTEYGALRGIAMSVIRLAKCGPWHPGGFDPVPVQRRNDEPNHRSDRVVQ